MHSHARTRARAHTHTHTHTHTSCHVGIKSHALTSRTHLAPHLQRTRVWLFVFLTPARAASTAPRSCTAPGTGRRQTPRPTRRGHGSEGQGESARNRGQERAQEWGGRRERCACSGQGASTSACKQTTHAAGSGGASRETLAGARRGSRHGARRHRQYREHSTGARARRTPYLRIARLPPRENAPGSLLQPPAVHFPPCITIHSSLVRSAQRWSAWGVETRFHFLSFF